MAGGCKVGLSEAISPGWKQAPGLDGRAHTYLIDSFVGAPYSPGAIGPKPLFASSPHRPTARVLRAI